MKSDELRRKQLKRLVKRLSLIGLLLTFLLFLLVSFSQSKIKELQYREKFQSDFKWKERISNQFDSLVKKIDTTSLNEWQKSMIFTTRIMIRASEPPIKKKYKQNIENKMDAILKFQ
ncbi:MAG: hypothetical protein IPH57_05075 [Saprospiraceae bacterium]|nr:hypothetical protein [Saprospiraceae bacterium]